jgi:hypothetical protein
MKFNLINRLFEKFEKDLTLHAKMRLNSFFQSSYSIIIKKSNDSPEVCNLIDKYNNKVKTFNQTGEVLAYLLWQKWDDLQPQVQDDLLGVIDEWLRLRSVNKNSSGYFRNINQKMHELENKMYKLENDKDGIITLKKQIEKLRKR